jgi:hypothetical protein
MRGDIRRVASQTTADNGDRPMMSMTIIVIALYGAAPA